MSPQQPKIDLVIPVYNEAGVIERTHAALRVAIDALPYPFRIYYIDDGSEDGTVASLQALAAQDARVTVLELSRNFGHQAALTAEIGRAHV